MAMKSTSVIAIAVVLLVLLGGAMQAEAAGQRALLQRVCPAVCQYTRVVCGGVLNRNACFNSCNLPRGCRPGSSGVQDQEVKALVSCHGYGVECSIFTRMGESSAFRSWSWEVPAFEPRSSSAANSTLWSDVDGNNLQTPSSWRLKEEEEIRKCSIPPSPCPAVYQPFVEQLLDSMEVKVKFVQPRYRQTRAYQYGLSP
ncbi:hypothetical protein SELMODRAFT_416968 [Selaginella moellendorffii]|uniref:VDE lipocalin domain-containing protein n=1 Tax=Selaginella moellendorffii TaxID=88036 RepID=D8S0Y7_SELML|nr:hypothetical protein SELMODRAFT_416968 [Selaginella moellendorffii]